MIGRRIGYVLLMLGAWATFIWTENSIALFFGVFLSAIPISTFVALLIASRRVVFDCSVRDTCMRGGALGIQMQLGISPRFFVGSAEITVLIENTTFSKVEKKVFVFNDFSHAAHVFDYIGSDSGRIRMSVQKIRLLDVFGISSWNIRRKDVFESVISPVLYDRLNINLDDTSVYSNIGDKVDATHRGNDRSEIFNVRDYIPGDSLNTVHWKLSGKFDTLKSKEYGNTSNCKMLILVDLSRQKYEKLASDSQLNSVLDVVVSVSNALCEQGILHSVGWLDESGLHCVEVHDKDTFIKMTFNLMSAKVSETNAKVAYSAAAADVGNFTRFVFVSSDAQVEEMRVLGGEVTSIAVGEYVSEYVDEKIRMINIQPDQIGEVFAGGTI